MIRDYTNIAANERTFLAWVRTGIAVIALGFVIERFNLFLLTIAGAMTVDAERLPIHRLEHPAGRYGGEALIGAGVMLIVISTIRFIHTARLLSRDEPYTARATSVSLSFLAALLLAIAAFSAYLAIL
jgi:putative membrane protein